MNMYFTKVPSITIFKTSPTVWVNALLPIFLNSASGSRMVLQSNPKAQHPITSVLYLAKIS